jgi:membrane fusion protein, heavy metal efflux system
MESNNRNQHWKIAGIAFIALIVGLALGMILYPRLFGTHSSQPSLVTSDETGKSAELESSPDVIQITLASQKEVGIVTEKAGYHGLKENLSTTGTVSEDPSRVAHIRPLARGLIEKAYVRLGDHVYQGDPLVEYDNIELGLALGEYQTAQAELQRSLTDLEVKRTILDRGKELLKAGAIARSAYDLREAEYKDAEAKTGGSRATIAKIVEQIRRFGWTDQDLANLPARQRAGHSIAHSVLKAPSSGIITYFHASAGEAVEPTTELLAITDMSSLWVLADVFEKDLAHVQTGKAVQVRVPAYPEKVFLGRITYVADILEPKTRTAKVRCVVENSSGLLKLEMFANIAIPVDRSNSVLAVPDSAIQQIDGKPVVFVRSSVNEFKKRVVETGLASGGYTEIRSGITAGESVTVQGSFVVKTAFLRNRIGGDE